MVQLSNGESCEADVVISAVGVEPSVEWVGEGLERGEDGGLLVGGDMRTSADAVYAAGDACTVRRGAHGPQWFQMRLWTQVREGGHEGQQGLATTRGRSWPCVCVQ